MTLAEFLAWEEQQDGRFEFNGREPEEMTGGTDRHSAIKIAVCALLRSALRGSDYRVFNSDLKIETMGRIRYPDAFVAGSVLDRSRIRRDPIVIFEVLSDSTATKDRTVKSAEYRATSSVRRYVMLEEDEIAATVFERDGEDWVGHLLLGPAARIEMPEIGVALSLGDVYDDILSTSEEDGQ